MSFNVYPQTNLNQQNLDWIVKEIKDLQVLIANGGVKVVTLAADMTNHGAIYVYVGTEAGMNTDHWYYWDNAAQTWVDGGSWGGGSVVLPLAITDGGTGAVDAAGARSNLGLGTLAVENDPLAIAKGGTGTTTAAGIRNAIGLGNTTGVLDVTHGGTGQTTKAAIRNSLGLGNTTGALPVANGGTGATSASAALAALGGEPAISVLPINKGGTGASSAATARTALGLGSLAVEDAPLSVAKGGTGETTAAGIKTALDIADIKGMTYKAVAGNANIDLTFGNGRHGLIVTTGSGSGQLDLVPFNVTNSGTISFVSIRSASSLTYTASTNTLNVANGASTYTFIFIIEF